MTTIIDGILRTNQMLINDARLAMTDNSLAFKFVSDIKFSSRFYSRIKISKWFLSLPFSKILNSSWRPEDDLSFLRPPNWRLFFQGGSSYRNTCQRALKTSSAIERKHSTSSSSRSWTNLAVLLQQRIGSNSNVEKQGND